MARFLIKDIVFDTRSLDDLSGDPVRSLELQQQWKGRVFECDREEGLDEDNIGSSLLMLMNSLVDITECICYKIDLESLDIQVPRVLKYFDEWGAPDIPLYPLRRSTQITVS